MALRSKARNESSSGSESDSDAPEAITQTQAKKTVQKLESSRQSALKAERESRRAQNQQRDKALKERAEKNKVLVKEKGKGKGKEKEQQPELEEEDSDDVSQDEDVSAEEDVSEDADPNGLEARMRRAMMEAQDEESGSDEGEYEDFEGVEMNGDSDDDEEDEDESDSNSSGDDEDESESGEASGPPAKKSTKFNPNHLPDEIFAAAFASQSNTKRTFTDPEEEKAPSRPTKKRKSAANSNTPKDIVVGSRAIRVLSTSSHPKTPSAAPSRKINKFLDRTLALKAGKQRGKGWERRPVNIGVLRRAGGPAANFVRNQAS